MPRPIDLSHVLSDGLPNFPGDPQIRIHAHHAIPAKPCNVAELTLSSHQGTHLDAPRHFYADGRTVDVLPLERCYGPATLVDLAPGTALAPGAEIGIAQLRAHADKFTRGARVLYRTGWDRQFGRKEFFEHFPSLTAEAAEWIASRRIALLGMDTPTPGRDFLACHLALLAPPVEIVIVEGLARLEQLPGSFTFIGFPLKLDRGDGSPIRAVAIVED